MFKTDFYKIEKLYDIINLKQIKYTANTATVNKIIRSTWPACTDPGKIPGNPFITDVIVSNPPTMGHIHVAEALGVPLHIMFPQPWFYRKYFFISIIFTVSF